LARDLAARTDARRPFAADFLRATAFAFAFFDFAISCRSPVIRLKKGCELYPCLTALTRPSYASSDCPQSNFCASSAQGQQRIWGRGVNTSIGDFIQTPW
jgi:hypothetical protein